MERIKPYLKYIYLFVFFFLCLLFFYTVNKGDTYVNYGFSYAISKGEVPYRDFNMVIPPAAPFVYAFFLFFSKSIIFYYMGQAILLSILFFYLFKLLGEKAWLFLLGMLVPFPIAMSTTIFPGYNFLVFLLLIIIIYCEKRKKSDLLIGLLLGLVFCTKQTVGISLFIPSLYYLWKNPKKFFTRLGGYLIPVFILFFYLIFTGSLGAFIDLCFLGLFDFGSSNRSTDYFYLVLLVLSIIYLIRKIIKDKKNILYYYALCFLPITLPIIDYYHVSLFLLIILFIILDEYKLKRTDISRYVIIILSVIILGFLMIEKSFFKEVAISNYHNFPLTVVSRKYDQNVRCLLQYVEKCDKEVVYLMRGSENYFFKIITDKKINYFDLPNQGNYGYNGVEKIVNKVKKLHDVVIVLDRELVNNTDSNQQYIKEIGREVIGSSKKIKSIGIYDIYLKN